MALPLRGLPRIGQQFSRLERKQAALLNGRLRQRNARIGKKPEVIMRGFRQRGFPLKRGIQ